MDISDKQTNIKIFFDMALERIGFFLCFFLVILLTNDDMNMNCHCWKLRNKIQGISHLEKRIMINLMPAGDC